MGSKDYWPERHCECFIRFCSHICIACLFVCFVFRIVIQIHILICTQVYAKQEYELAFVFPEGYPFSSPKVTFVTPCFHPNVDQYGNICLDILKVGSAVLIYYCCCLHGTAYNSLNLSSNHDTHLVISCI